MSAETMQEGSSMRAARLTFAQGVVTVETADAQGAQPAQLNLPLLTGVRLSTGDDGQAEIEFEDGSVLRLTPNSTVSLDRLSVDPSGVFTTAVTLVRGLAYAELRAASEYHYTLTAGGDVLSPIENTTVRVNFDQPPASFAVMAGTAQISRKDGGDTRQLHAGETLRADDQTGSYSISPDLAGDSWDAWNSDRDRAAAQESSEQTGVRDVYAGAQGYGWADLDADGTWYDVPGQGEVWQPTVAVEDAAFDPYGFGSWVWYPGAGYVWAAGYSWGWTPYRCGSWNYFNSFGWGWSPAAACGGFGWTFWRMGAPVNIGTGPGGYRVPVVPRPHPGPIHPILPTRHEPSLPAAALAGMTGWGTLLQRGPREVNGVIATPVERRDAPEALQAATGTGALARDFPVDRNSHVALTGRIPSEPGLVHTESGWQRANTPAAQGFTGQSGAAIFRERLQGNEPASMGRIPYTPPANTSVRPYGVESGARPAYAPPQGMQRPTYTRPTRQMYAPTPGYAPPAQMQRPYIPPAEVPHYSPSPAPVQHSAPPAPAARSPR